MMIAMNILTTRWQESVDERVCTHYTMLLFFYAAAYEVDAYMFYRCFFLVFFCLILFFVFFSVRQKNTRQPFSGTALNGFS